MARASSCEANSFLTRAGPLFLESPSERRYTASALPTTRTSQPQSKRLFRIRREGSSGYAHTERQRWYLTSTIPCQSTALNGSPMGSASFALMLGRATGCRSKEQVDDRGALSLVNVTVLRPTSSLGCTCSTFCD